MLPNFINTSLPTASIIAIEQFLKLLSAQAEALLKINGAKCVSYFKGDVSGFNASDIPSDLLTKELQIGADVISSTNSYSGPIISEAEIEEALLNAITKASGVLGLTIEDYAKGLNYELDAKTNCNVFITYFNSLVDAPNTQKNQLLRYIAQNLNP